MHLSSKDCLIDMPLLPPMEENNNLPQLPTREFRRMYASHRGMLFYDLRELNAVSVTDYIVATSQICSSAANQKARRDKRQRMSISTYVYSDETFVHTLDSLNSFIFNTSYKAVLNTMNFGRMYDMIPGEHITIPVVHYGTLHNGVIQNFTTNVQLTKIG